MRILILSLDYGLTTELIYLWRINDKLSNLLTFNNYKVKYLIHWFALTWSSLRSWLRNWSSSEALYWYWRRKNPFSGELFSLLRKLFWKMTKIIFFCRVHWTHWALKRGVWDHVWAPWAKFSPVVKSSNSKIEPNDSFIIVHLCQYRLTELYLKDIIFSVHH